MAETQQQAAAATTAMAAPTVDTKNLTEAQAKSMLDAIVANQQRAMDNEVLGRVRFGENGLEASDLAGMWRMATMYARSDIVPEQYRGKAENCLIALQMAQRCRMDPFAFMQSSYIVHGRPGIEGKLAIAMLNTSGKIKGRLRYEFAADKKSCTAIVTDKESGDEIKMTVDWKTVEAEGWNKKAGSKWLTIPDQMFRYRSAVFLIRAHYPEVMMGLQTVDELEDAAPPASSAKSPPPNGRQVLTGNREERPDPHEAADSTGAGAVTGQPDAEPTGAASEPSQEEQDQMALLDLLSDLEDRIKAAAHPGDIDPIKADIDKHRLWMGDKNHAQLNESADAKAKQLQPAGNGRRRSPAF